MAPQKVRSELHPQDGDRRGRGPGNRGRSIAAFVVVALIAGGGLALVLTRDDPTPPPTDPGPANASPAAVPAGDFAFVDVATGELTPGPELGTSVDWLTASPDGKRIAYTSWVEGRPLVHVANVDGSDARAYEQTEPPSVVGATGWLDDGTLLIDPTA